MVFVFGLPSGPGAAACDARACPDLKMLFPMPMDSENAPGPHRAGGEEKNKEGDKISPEDETIDDKNSNYIDCSSFKDPNDERNTGDEAEKGKIADSDLNELETNGPDAEHSSVVAENLEIDPAVLKCIIETINIFNHKSEEEGSDVTTVRNKRFTASAYSATPLAESLRGSVVSQSVIYNNKIRGRSDSLVFFTSDFLYAIKIIRKSEFVTIRKYMSRFVEYYGENQNTLLVKYYGIYELNMADSSPIYFVLMKNVFDGFYEKIYDLKGTSVKRTNKSGILTEQDWMNYKLPVGNREHLIEQINKDSQFLCSLNLMDYSIVIGLHSVPSHPDFKMVSSGRRKEVRLLRPVREFSIGIVDTLTEFDTAKWLEWFYYICCCRGNMSAIRPQHYRRRFMDLVTTGCFVNLDEEKKDEESS